MDKIEALISTDNWITQLCSLGPPLYYKDMVTNDAYCHYCNDSTITDSTTPTGVIAANVVFETPLVNDGQWHKMIGYYQAQGGEKYISLGIFYQNERLFEMINEYKNAAFPRRKNQKKLEKFHTKYRNDLFIHRNPVYTPQTDTIVSKPVYEYLGGVYTYYFVDNVSVMEIR